MKKFVLPIIFLLITVSIACKSHTKAQNLKRDSIASYKSSKATDTTKPIKPGSDTSYTHHNAPESIADSIKHR